MPSLSLDGVLGRKRVGHILANGIRGRSLPGRVRRDDLIERVPSALDEGVGLASLDIGHSSVFW